MHRLLPTVLLATMLAAPSFGGVVFEIDDTDHTTDPPTTSTSETKVEGSKLKMSVAAARDGAPGDLIFRGDRRAMLMVDHRQKTVTVMDEEGMTALSSQLGAAMSQIEKALENIPESQRKRVEEMMKKQLPQQVASALPEIVVKRTDERADRNGYPCTKVEVLADGRKTHELWVTDWSNIEGGAEVKRVFDQLADFMSGLTEALGGQGGLLGGIAERVGSSAYGYMKNVDGFPAVTTTFALDGSVEHERSLRSSERADVDDDDFEPPKKYKVRNLGSMMAAR